MLPRVYRRDPEGAWFMDRFLALFEGIFTGIENRYELFSKQINPDAAPLEIINWLACLIDLSFDPSWDLQRRRDLVNRAMELYKKRGTPQGIADYIEIYTGVRPTIKEAFLQRPREATFLGNQGSILGCPMHLRAHSENLTPEQQILADYAHRFTVLVYVLDDCDTETLLPVVERIVEVNKPAHTGHELCPVYPDMRVGVQSTVGMDTVVGGRGASGTRITGCGDSQTPNTPRHILGVDAVLGNRRPSYVRPHGIQL
jgi:phage tail-like protein